jgi:Cdc6-like AAA superfamily ATPase
MLILVLFIGWLALKINIRVRKAQAKTIKKINLANYVTFASNFTQAEEAERKGDRRKALQLFKRALQILEDDENQDEITLETKKEVVERIAALEKP